MNPNRNATGMRRFDRAFRRVDRWHDLRSWVVALDHPQPALINCLHRDHGRHTRVDPADGRVAQLRARSRIVGRQQGVYCRLFVMNAAMQVSLRVVQLAQVIGVRLRQARMPQGPGWQRHH